MRAEMLWYYLFNRLSAMFQISPFLSRHGLRRATLSPGEGLSVAQLNAKLEGTSKNSCFVLDGLFDPTLRSENLEIHTVFLRFSELNLSQKSSPNPKTIVFRGTLEFE